MSSTIQPIIANGALPTENLVTHRHYLEARKTPEPIPKKKTKIPQFLRRKRRRPRGLLQVVLSDARSSSQDSCLCREVVTIPELETPGELGEIGHFPKRCADLFCEIAIPVPADKRRNRSDPKTRDIHFLFELRVTRLEEEQIPSILPFLCDDLRALVSLSRFVSLFKAEPMFDPPLEAIRFILSDWESGSQPVHVVLVSIGEGLDVAMNSLRSRQADARGTSDEGVSKPEDAMIDDAQELFHLIVRIMSEAKVLENTRKRASAADVSSAASSQHYPPAESDELDADAAAAATAAAEEEDSDSIDYDDVGSRQTTTEFGGEDSEDSGSDLNDGLSDSDADEPAGGEGRPAPQDSKAAAEDPDAKPRNIRSKIGNLFKKLRNLGKKDEAEAEVRSDIFDDMPLPSHKDRPRGRGRKGFTSKKILNPDNEI